MSRKLAERLSSVAPSATLAMAAKAGRLRAEGHKVFPFSVGEPDFITPAHIREAAKAALDAGATHYTPVTGTAELKAAICAATERHRGWRPLPGQVTVSCGAKHALFNLAVSLFEPGDEVLIPAPYWVSYPEQVRLVGATPRIVDTTEEQGFRLTAEALSAALTPQVKAIILCSPSNPTGSAYTAEHLAVLADVLRRHDCWIIMDEIYSDLVYDGFRHVTLPSIAEDLAPRLIIVDGVSKTYAMTGWRIGWSISPIEVAKALDVVQGQSTTNAAAVSQAAAVAALNGPRDDIHAMRAAFGRRRDVMVRALNAIPGVRCRMPEGAFYAFADFRALRGRSFQGRVLASDIELADFFLEQGHAATVAGTPFGAPGYLRLSYACDEADIEAGIAAIRRAVEMLD
ncbi:pyridoxal phosphate-dependent aminotransferase [Chondromyces apiculatus]|uniref:Aminotransferase n=1 Tax=Chondromyces apiculatus DSM 436 TaxID=1192034 RepID=A0A017TFF1_9BACT|nr:pyridoxal phosphate-dependent aminotransferase [Chondromyces apiculatus]EYF07346.1 Aspartate aminotransferase [Chondromyces apiculatus DSM 436]